MIVSEKLAAFKEKLALRIRRVKVRNLVNFPWLEETVVEDASLHPELVAKIVEHLQMLCTSFGSYFLCGELQTCDYWTLNPFKQNLEDIDDENNMKEHPLDPGNNFRTQMDFTNSQLEHFWASQLEAYPVLAKEALKVLVPFATTYTCEQGF